jgi:leader peptidase (prepilin peptidase)/N-methyltransferase
MMERDWKKQCHDYLELDAPEFDDYTKSLGLSSPRSACPSCGHKITALENIPVLSYMVLGGKCSACETHISAQYPTVEFITGVMSLIVAMHFGVTLTTIAALIFTWSLIALTLIDFHKQLLPDDITYPLLWLGILYAFTGDFTDLASSVIGAIAGYLVLWLVFHIFKIVTGKEGMGYGDFKLLAALGAWCGWQLLPQIILLSSLVGAVTGIIMLITGYTKRAQPIPFGPYLATAGWIALLWGEQINSAYLGYIQ